MPEHQEIERKTGRVEHEEGLTLFTQFWLADTFLQQVNNFDMK